MPSRSLLSPRVIRALLLLTLSAAPGCIVPHVHHLEHVSEIERVLGKQPTRGELRAKLGPPTMVDTPELYVYDWEKAKAIGIGYFGGIPMGHTGTRALFVFDDAGSILRSEIRGTGQNPGKNPESAPKPLPVADFKPPSAKECSDGKAAKAWFEGREPRLILRLPGEIRVCDAEASQELERMQGQFLDLAFSSDGRLAAAYDRNKSLTLRDGSTLEQILELEPPSPLGATALMRWGLGISFSEDGGRVAAYIGKRGVYVYDTSTGKATLRLEGRWSPRLSPDGRLVASKGPAGFFLTEVESGRDVAARPLPHYP